MKTSFNSEKFNKLYRVLLGSVQKNLTGTWKQLLIVLLNIYFMLMGFQFARVVSGLHDLVFL
jgi:hypothetical protein